MQWLIETFGATHVYVSLLIFILGMMGIFGGFFGKKKLWMTSVVSFGIMLVVFGAMYIVIDKEEKKLKEENKYIENQISTTGTYTEDFVEEETIGGTEGELKEGITVSDSSMEITYEELQGMVKELGKELGVQYNFEEDIYSDLEETDVYYTREKDSKVGITTTVTKEKKEVSRIQFELEEGGKEERLRELIGVYVAALDEDTEDAYAGYFLGSLLSVKPGESITKDINGKEYSASNSKSNGLMFFIHKGIEIY